MSDETKCCAVWDFTCWDTTHINDPAKIIPVLKDQCKKWSFQKEEGEKNGGIHLQGRVSFKTKCRKPTAILRLKELKANISLTSTASMKDDFYVTKAEGRLEGPWKDTDEVVYIPRDVREMKELYPWQAKLLKIIQVYDPRRIQYVFDPEGNKGKTGFQRYCMVYGYGQIIPFCNDYKDLLRMVMDMPENKCYIIDMPRAINKEKLFQLYAAIETVKGGYACDDRYHFKQKIFDPPNIVVFANMLPNRDLLTGDRWRFWEIIDGDLKKI